MLLVLHVLFALLWLGEAVGGSQVWARLQRLWVLVHPMGCLDAQAVSTQELYGLKGQAAPTQSSKTQPCTLDGGKLLQETIPFSLLHLFCYLQLG